MLFGNSVTADIISQDEVRKGRVSLKVNMSFQKECHGKRTALTQGAHHVMTEAESGMMPLQASEHCWVPVTYG